MIAENQWELIGYCIYCGGSAYQMEGMGQVQWEPKIYGCQCRLIDFDVEIEEEDLTYSFDEMREAA